MIISDVLPKALEYDNELVPTDRTFLFSVSGAYFILHRFNLACQPTCRAVFFSTLFSSNEGERCFCILTLDHCFSLKLCPISRHLG